MIRDLRVVLVAVVLAALIFQTSNRSEGPGVALAQTSPPQYQEAYAQDPNPGTYRTAVGANDPVDLGDATMASLALDNRPTLRISARFSVAGASCVLQCVKGKGTGASYIVFQVDEITATASATHTIGGAYAAQDALFDTGGMQVARIRIRALSGGTVTLVYSRN